MCSRVAACVGFAGGDKAGAASPSSGASPRKFFGAGGGGGAKDSAAIGGFASLSVSGGSSLSSGAGYSAARGKFPRRLQSFEAWATFEDLRETTQVFWNLRRLAADSAVVVRAQAREKCVRSVPLLARLAHMA